MSNRQIEALTEAAEKKKQEALAKTELAIQTLIDRHHKITIRSVAREAAVSVSYIYKYPELAYKIQKLREQQKYDLVKPEFVNNKYERIAKNELCDRIEILEREKQELSQELELLKSNIDAMSKSNNSLDRLQAENIRLLQENKQLQEQVALTKEKLAASREFILTQGYNSEPAINTKTVKQIILPEEKVAPVLLSGQSLTEMSTIDEEIQWLLSEVGIKLSKTLIQEINSQPKEKVIKAISGVRENINNGIKINSKVSLFRAAVQQI
jgi:hypothetical protein